MISCRDWWPRTKPVYITKTRRQSNNHWCGGIAAHTAPKNSECKNPLEKFSPRIFWGSRRHPPHWLSSKGQNYQSRVLLISAGTTEGHFEGKTPQERHRVCLVLAQSPGSPSTYNPEETGLPGLPVPWSTTLFSESYPVGISPLPWTEKAIERSPFFVRGGHCCHGNLVGRTTFWVFFEMLAKVRTKG